MNTRALTVAAALTLGACGHPPEPRPRAAAAEPREVAVAPAQVQSLKTHYVATATVRGRNTAVLTSKAMGYVRALRAGNGDHVEAGQVLVELDERDARAGLQGARAGVSGADAAVVQAERDLEAARADLHLAERTLERMRRLAGERAVTPHELDEAEAGHASAQARARMAEAGLRAARARLGQARAGVEMASSLLGHRQVVAPFAGRVVARHVDVGDMASPGAPLLTLEEDGALRAEAVVDESQAGRIAIGDAARVEVEAAGARIEGTVGEIVPAIDVASRAFVVKVDLTGDPAALRPGMFARVRFATGTADRLVVPAAAVSVRGQLERVFVAEGDRARMRFVTLGADHDGRVEVRSGLEAGETVVLAPPADLADAAPIRVRP